MNFFKKIFNQKKEELSNRCMYQDILKNQDLNNKQLHELSNNADPIIKIGVINHKNITLAILTNLLNDKDINVRETACDKMQSMLRTAGKLYYK